MTKNALLEKLNGKLKENQLKFDALQNNADIRNIAFCSAGHLSKASKNRLNRHREQIGKVCDNISLVKLAIKIVEGEYFVLSDLSDIALNFLALRNPEFEAIFYTECFPIRKVAEMMNLIFEVYQLPYRKQILMYDLNYRNSHGVGLSIDLMVK